MAGDLRCAAEPVVRQRRSLDAWQLRRGADRLPAARRTARLDRRHQCLRAGRSVPLRRPRGARVVARGSGRGAGREGIRPLRRARCPDLAIPADGAVGRCGGELAVGAVSRVRRRGDPAPQLPVDDCLRPPSRGASGRKRLVEHRIPVRRLARSRRTGRAPLGGEDRPSPGGAGVLLQGDLGTRRNRTRPRNDRGRTAFRCPGAARTRRIPARVRHRFWPRRRRHRHRLCPGHHVRHSGTGAGADGGGTAGNRGRT
ncbi:hypothetical protein B7C42_07826 [Nocardia cerradoensis]|uniref:Uncharacterized protein n=1 Tax=Nocardia cerradoensis TaxID=85688 RepID=A0A231GU63_9NOCA|nr:hypothetical protein B7C42_07826 [Nocardia cerradoensis]